MWGAKVRVMVGMVREVRLDMVRVLVFLVVTTQLVISRHTIEQLRVIWSTSWLDKI